MKKAFLAFFLFLLAWQITAAEAAANVFILPLEGAVDKGMVMLVRRAVREIEAQQPGTVIIELNTPGGGIEETKEIIAWIRSIRRKTVPVYAWVHTDALSAGAMLAMSCDRIYMSGGATIGSAMPIAVSPDNEIMELPEDVQEKMLSAVRAMVTGLAQENGYREEVAVAMVDRNHPELSFTDRDGNNFKCPSGTLLNMTAKDAALIPVEDIRPLLSSGNADSDDALLKLIGHSEARVHRFQITYADRLAKWIIMLAPLLLSVGMLLIFKEIMSPGFGLCGIVGISLVAVNLFGHYVAGLAGVEEVVLLALGFILLALEIFVIPGFGVCGILGIVAIVSGLLMAFIPAMPDTAPLEGLTLPTFTDMLPGAILRVTMVFVICAIGIFLMIRYLPHIPLLRGLVLSRDLGSGNGNDPAAVESRKQLVGMRGVAVTDLRPAGCVEIQGRKHDVITDGAYIRQGTPVTVIEESGTAIVVTACREEA